MNQKTTVVLLLTLIAAVGGLWWAQSSQKPAKPVTEAGPKALFDPEIGEVIELEIVPGGGTAMKFALRKEKWEMLAPVAGLAEHWMVDSDINKLKTLKYVRTFARDDASLTEEMTSLAKPLKVCKLTDKAGKSVVLKIGAPQALSRRTYVQIEGKDPIYLVQGDLQADLKRSAQEYRSKQVASFNAADAVRLEAAGERQYTLAKADAKWVIESPIKARADAGAVAGVFRAASAVSAVKFVDDKPANLRPYGLDKPRLTLAITTETKTPRPPPATQPASAPAQPEFDIETKSVRLAFGAPVEGNVFAKLDDPSSPSVFQISEATFKQIAVPLDDLRDKAITDLQTGRAQKIGITSGGQTIRLVRSHAVWQIESGLPSGAPSTAEFAAVDDLLKAIRELKAIAFEPSVSPAAQGLDPARASIEIVAEGQIEPLRLKVGGLTPSKTGAYVLNEGENAVYVVKADTADALAVRPMDFLSRELIQFARDRCSKIDLYFPKYNISLARQANSSNWDFTAPVKGAADFGGVNAILSDLFNLRGRRVVGLAADAARYNLDASAVKAVLTIDVPPIVKPKPVTTATSQDSGPPDLIPQPPETRTLIVSRKDGKGYAMTAGGATICEVDGKVLDDLLAELLNTQVAKIEASQALKLTFKGAASFVLEKAGDNWRLVGEPSFAADPAKITAFFTALNDLRASEYSRYSGAKLDEYGLAAPALTIVAEAEVGPPITLYVSGKGPDKGGRYACIDSVKDRVFVLKPEDVDKLMKNVKDFQK